MTLVYTLHHKVCLLALLNFFVAVMPAEGAFHFMQIEQIIGGVNGDTTAQAIQLRMSLAGQNQVQQASVRIVDATGANQITLENMTTSVPNGQLGRRVLLATSNFGNYTNIPLVADFIMDPIPASYLAAGQVRFLQDTGTIYWSLSWGGAGFTGSTTGSTTNDADGNFGPPVNIALPSTSLQALKFTGSATADSTTNFADYTLTTGAATFINNANTSFTLVAPDPPSADFDGDGDSDGRDFLKWQRGESPHPFASGDLELWQEQYTNPPLSAVVSIPEPLSLTLLIGGLSPQVIYRPIYRRRRITA